MANPKRPSYYFDGSNPARKVDHRRRSGTFEVAELWDVHKEVCRRLSLGQKGTLIAKDLGITTATVSYIKNSPLVQERVDNLHAVRDAETIDIAVEIRNNAPRALRLLEEIVDGDKNASINLRAKEANNMLDRAGYSAVRSIQSMNIHTHFTPEEIEEIKKRAVENGHASGMIIDADVEVVNAK